MSLMLKLAGTLVALGMASSISQAQDRVFKIGTEGAYPPFNVVDNTGKLQGLDIDIGNAICERLKARCEWIAQSFDGLIPALQNGQFDMVIASHSITEDRLKVVDMVKYYDNTASFAVLADDTTADLSPETYDGKAIGAQSGTVHASYLEQHYPKSDLKFYPTQVEAYADLKSGRIDAVMGDTTSLYDWVRKEGKSCCKLSQGTIGDASLGEGVGIILPKGSAIEPEVKNAVDEIRKDGTFDKLSSAYFPFSLWKN